MHAAVITAYNTSEKIQLTHLCSDNVNAGMVLSGMFVMCNVAWRFKRQCGNGQLENNIEAYY